jgi:hypothetical protein
MLLLLQLLKTLTTKQRALFFELFSDLNYEINDLGYKGHESDLINDMLFNHLLISLEDNMQLQRITECILDKRRFNLVKNLLERGAV